MLSILSGFRSLEKWVFHLVTAVFFAQLVEAGLFLLLNYYLRGLDYADQAIAQLTAYRYMAIMALALPLGIFIKGRRLRPFFYASVWLTPLLTLAALYGLSMKWWIFSAVCLVLWGLARLLLSVSTLPFLVNNIPEEQHSEAITLYFMTSSLSIFVMGLLYAGLHHYLPAYVDEGSFLYATAFLSLGSLFFLSRVKVKEQLSEKANWRKLGQSFDWGSIALVSVPTLLIAIGAGLTIPFVNLFFQQVHGIDSAQFSLIGSGSFVLVSLALIFMPKLQRQFGYRIAITLFQSLAVLMLFIMATTEFYAQWPYAGALAIVAYLLRQPLMNVAGPSTSELSLHYVGERNREMIGAINAAIWSGSWFFSSMIFAYLRAQKVAYAHIFFMTVGLYVLAILWYAFLIRKHRKSQVQQEKEEEALNLQTAAS